MDRRITAAVFRERLVTIMQRSGLNQSQFAQRLKIDRSSLFQLLAPDTDRLPRVETLAIIASIGGVSLDWLLGLSDREQPDSQPDAVRIEPDAPSPVDERLMGWHREASGYKIRHVPLTLPDLLKTDATLAFEYRKSDAEGLCARLSWLRRPETDFEACNSLQAVTAFAQGHGVWRDLSVRQRRDQLWRLIELTEELYPTFRWFLYDETEIFSAPITIFGPQRAALYTGQGYLVFTAPEQVQALARQFDRLVRAAAVQPAATPDYLRGLVQQVA